jgi:FixJ family two-component response regulator
MIMPKMGGVDTFRELRKIDPNAKIIIASGFSNSDSVHMLQKEGAVDFIGKPYRQEELLKMLSKYAV